MENKTVISNESGTITLANDKIEVGTRVGNKLLNVKVKREDGAVITYPVINLDSSKIQVTKSDNGDRKANVTFELEVDEYGTLFYVNTIGSSMDSDKIMEEIMVK